MQMLIILGLGAAAWYAWSHKDVPFQNPVDRRPELDSRDVLRMRRAGRDVRQLADELAGDWLEWSSWCMRHGYEGEADEAEAIADDLIEIATGAV